MGGIFECNEKVTVLDVGPNYMITDKGFIRILQEAANLASSQVGHGIADIERTGTTWVILYWRLKVYKRAGYNDALTVKTWANFFNKIYSLREFEVYCNGELIAQASSKWVFVDAKNHTIHKITDDIISIYEPVEKRLFETELNERIKLPSNLDEAYKYTIMKRDLDANHHVNNLCFLDIAIEALPDNVIDEDFNNISIIYKKEMLYKDTITCYYEFKNDEHIIYMYNKEKNILNGVVILKKSKK